MKAHLMLAALAFLAIAPAALAQPSDPRSTSERTDRNGVRWLYGERKDVMDDSQQVAVAALWRRARIGLFCIQDEGTMLQVGAPEWFFVPDQAEVLQARIDQGPAFEVTAVGDRDGRSGTVRPNRAGRELARGFATARERIALRNNQGGTIIILRRQRHHRLRQRGLISPHCRLLALRRSWLDQRAAGPALGHPEHRLHMPHASTATLGA